MLTVGVVGCGRMGTLIIERFVAKGDRVIALDPNPDALRNAQEIGSETAEKIQDLTECSHIVLSLPTPGVVRNMVAGPGGIIAKAGANTRILIDTSTIDINTSIEMAEAARKQNLTYLDSPILGRPAAPAFWAMPVGGDRAEFDRVLPVLETIARKAFYIGPSGSGTKLKLINQIMFATINMVYCEAFSFAEKSGIGADLFYEVLEGSGASTVSSLFKEVGRRIREQDFSPSFSIDLLEKDVGLSLDFISSFSGKPLATGLTGALVHAARAAGFGGQDNAAIYEFLRTHVS